MYEYRRLTSEQRKQLVKDRLARGSPPHSPPHPVRLKTCYLLTAACYEHECHMGSEKRRRQLLDKLFEQFISAGMEIRAWVILPNHYHLLANISNFDQLGHLFHLVHGQTSHQWNAEDCSVGRRVWYRYTDRAIRSEAHYYATLNYLHYNPVKHGWAKSPYDWAESSVHWYLEHFGREWLRDGWCRFPVRQYGKGWDDI